jgi:hypothetical protein
MGEGRCVRANRANPSPPTPLFTHTHTYTHTRRYYNPVAEDEESCAMLLPAAMKRNPAGANAAAVIHLHRLRMQGLMDPPRNPGVQNTVGFQKVWCSWVRKGGSWDSPV